MAEIENGKWYASNGKGNLGVTLGAIGTGLALLGNHAGDGWGLFGGNSDYVSKETFDKQTEISALNSRIALLEAEKNTNDKMIDVYERVTQRQLENERAYASDKAAQQVINANVQSAIAVNTNNIQQLMGMTGLYIESSRVTPLPMARYNSWTEPTTSSSSGT